MRRLAKRTQLEKLGVRAGNNLTEADLDAMLVAEKNRQAQLFHRFERGRVAKFWALGVQILMGDDEVYTVGNHDPWDKKTNTSRLLGSLAGAEAGVTDTTSSFSVGKAMIMPLVTAPLARKETAHAVVVFADGTTQATALDGSREVREARKQAVEFNALASASSPGAAETGHGPAARLRKLGELRDAGLLSQQEYETQRAAVINSI